MSWQRLATQALDLDAGVSPARAQAITAALWPRLVPVLRHRAGRLEPLASAVLYRHRARLLLATCRHVFDEGVALGDLFVPLGDGRGVLRLGDAAPRLLVHERQDVALIAINAAWAAERLAAAWRTAPLPDEAAALPPAAALYVIAGYPYAQMRRVDGVLVARPLVAFARRLDDATALLLGYPRVARRDDGLEVHAPPLDGVSGATLWQVHEGDGAGIECLLQAGGVQVAFKPGAYARGEPLAAVHDLARRLVH